MHCWKQMHFAPYKSFFRKFKVGKIIWASVLTQYHVCHRPHFPLHCHLCLNLFSYRKCMKCGFKYSKREIFSITTGNFLQSLAILVRVLLLNQEPKQCLISNLTERLWLCNQDSFLLFFIETWQVKLLLTFPPWCTSSCPWKLGIVLVWFSFQCLLYSCC